MRHLKKQSFVTYPGYLNYAFIAGETIGYLNVTSLVGEEGSITEGTYEEIDAVRSVSIAQKFKVVTIVLHKNHSDVNVSVTLQGKDKNGDSFEVGMAFHAGLEVILLVELSSCTALVSVLVATISIVLIVD